MPRPRCRTSKVWSKAALTKNEAADISCAQMSGEADSSTSEQRFQGLGVSPGLARGRIVVVRPEEDTAPDYAIAEADIPGEVARFEAALLSTRAQILDMQAKIAEAIGAKDASIFDAHLLVVEDRTLIDEVLRALVQEKRNIEVIFQRVADRYSALLDQMDDAYLRERALDVHDVTRRVLMNLVGKQAPALSEIDYPHILLAYNLTPSDTALLNRELVLGFATDAGSRTSHTAIMARSLNIPAIVGLHDVSARLESGMEVLLDGFHGLLVLNPSDQTRSEYEELERRKQRLEAGLVTLRETASNTIDGHHLVLSANIELPDDIPMVKSSGAEGIGLYRTEFFYLNKNEFPKRGGAIRRLSAGRQRDPAAWGDYPHAGPGRGQVPRAAEYAARDEPVPWLAGDPVLPEREDIFKVQLRAILRASALGNVKLMYPLISGIEEVRRANEILAQCKKELRAEGKPFDDNMHGWRDDRSAERGVVRRADRQGGGFLQHRHERFDPIHHRG